MHTRALQEFRLFGYLHWKISVSQVGGDPSRDYHAWWSTSDENWPVWFIVMTICIVVLTAVLVLLVGLLCG